LSAEASPHTPAGELTALIRRSNWFNGGSRRRGGKEKRVEVKGKWEENWKR